MAIIYSYFPKMKLNPSLIDKFWEGPCRYGVAIYDWSKWEGIHGNPESDIQQPITLKKSVDTHQVNTNTYQIEILTLTTASSCVDDGCLRHPGSSTVTSQPLVMLPRLPHSYPSTRHTLFTVEKGDGEGRCRKEEDKMLQSSRKNLLCYTALKTHCKLLRWCALRMR